MNAYETRLAQIVSAYLPGGAVIATIERPVPHPALLAADLNADGNPEIAALYRYDNALYLLILYKSGESWTVRTNEKGPGYGVTLLTAAPVTSPGRNNLLVGWQAGAIWSQLSVYDWQPHGLGSAAAEPLYFSYIEVLRPQHPGSPGGKAELALWIHDTGEAYRVEVLRDENGRFVPAQDAYPSYFRKVARYYEDMVSRHPDYTFYWYYLADAQHKAGLLPQALLSVRKALSFPQPYPSREELRQLEHAIVQAMHVGHRVRQHALFPASVKTVSGTKWGYIDRHGTMKLEPKFESAEPFQPNGLAVVRTKEGSGLINETGTFIVPPTLDSISDFQEGRAVVIDRDGFKLMDEQGKIVTKKTYSFMSSLHEGRAMVSLMNEQYDSKYGYLDRDGNEVIPPQYESAGDFHNGKAVVQVKDKAYALLDKEGRELASYPYPFVGALGEGLLSFQQETGGKYGYIDEKGSVVLPPAYSYAGPFENGLAIVDTSEDYKSKYGVIDRRGTFIVKPVYNEIRRLGSNRLALGRAIDEEEPFKGSQFAIANENGEWLTDFLYYDVTEYKDGLASVYDRKQTYFIDLSGNAAAGYPRVNGSGTLKLEDGLIAANVDQRLSYLALNGRVIWKQNDVIPLTPPYRVREVKYKPNKDYLVYYPQVEGMSSADQQKRVNDRLKELSEVRPVPADRPLEASYNGDFEIAFYQKDLLELQLTGYNYPFGAAHGMPTMIYVPIDLKTGEIYALKDLFKPGSDYTTVLSDIVGKQIKEDPQYSYVFPDSYKGIAPDQPFFVTADALHVYFAPYEIGPYAAGFPTFKIPFAQLDAILAKDRPFWQSFH